MRLAVLLITCDREEYTAATLQSFDSYNGNLRAAGYPVNLYHIDDASAANRNVELAERYGFKTLYRGNSRAGNTATRRHGIRITANACFPTHILLLENDWECTRPIPWKALQQAFDHPEHDIYHVRLWHHFKSRVKYDSWDKVTPLVSRGHAGRDRAAPDWQPLSGTVEPIDVGDIHWGAPPSVTRTEELLWLHHNVTSEHESIKKSGKIQARTAQVKTNVFFHIGEVRTPGFVR